MLMEEGTKAVIPTTADANARKDETQRLLMMECIRFKTMTVAVINQYSVSNELVVHINYGMSTVLQN